MKKWFIVTTALVLLLTGCSHKLISESQAKQFVLDKHKNNPDGKVVITSVSHSDGEYKVNWKVDSKIVDYGTDYVSDTTGKITHGTTTIQ